MSYKKKRLLVPVSKLAEFADDPEAFRKNLGRVRDPTAAAAGTKAHQNCVKPRKTGPRIGKAIAFVAIAVAIALFLLAH